MQPTMHPVRRQYPVQYHPYLCTVDVLIALWSKQHRPFDQGTRLSRTAPLCEMEEIQKQYCIEVLLSLSNATNTVGEKTHTHTLTESDHDGARDAEVHLRHLLLELRQKSPASSRRNLPYIARYLPVVPESFENKNEKNHTREHSEDRSEPSFYSIFPGNDQYRFPSANSPPIIPWRGILNLT